MPLLEIGSWSVGMCLIKFVSTISYKLFVGISPNLQLDTVGDRDKLIRFEVKGQGCSETKYGQISTFGRMSYIYDPRMGIFCQIYNLCAIGGRYEMKTC